MQCGKPKVFSRLRGARLLIFLEPLPLAVVVKDPPPFDAEGKKAVNNAVSSFFLKTRKEVEQRFAVDSEKPSPLLHDQFLSGDDRAHAAHASRRTGNATHLRRISVFRCIPG